MAYYAAWPTIVGDIVWETLFALIKEPEPISVLLHAIIQGGVPVHERGTVYYANHLTDVCRALSGKDSLHVWKNLNNSGQRNVSLLSPHFVYHIWCVCMSSVQPCRGRQP